MSALISFDSHGSPTNDATTLCLPNSKCLYMPCTDTQNQWNYIKYNERTQIRIL